MENFVINIMNRYGYLGIFFLIMIENVFPPIPSEVILIFGGFITTSTKLKVIWVIVFSVLGSLFGAYLLYFVGKALNKEKLKKIVNSKYGKMLKIKSRDIESADKWFGKKGYKTVFFCRFIPIVRSLISVPAGMNQMSILKFSTYTLSASIIWNTILVLIGAYAGEKKEIFFKYYDQLSYFVLIILCLFVVIFIFKKYKKSKF